MPHDTGKRGVSRRQLLEGAGVLALAVMPVPARAIQRQDAGRAEGSAPADLTGRVARYMAAAATRELPAAVTLAAKHRILETLAAIVSGARLKPGATNYSR